MSQNRIGPTGGAIVTPGAQSLDGVIADQLAASVNDYAPRGIADADAIFLTARAAVNITGLQGGLRARKLRIFIRTGSAIITLTNQDAASAAGNRFAIGGNIALAAGSVIDLFYDVESARWYSLSAIPFAHLGNLVGFQILSVAGAGLYTPTAGATNAILAIIGGGGGGGGALAGVGSDAGAGGGGAGAFALYRIAALAVNYAVVIGAAGAGGAAGYNIGGNGGDTTLAALVTAPGGKGGGGGDITVLGMGGPGGAVATGGSINSGGANGGFALDNIAGADEKQSGYGGSGPYGAGGASRNTAIAGQPVTGEGAGNPGTGFGAGGGGALAAAGGANRAGGVGSGGAIIAWEYS